MVGPIIKARKNSVISADMAASEEDMRPKELPTGVMGTHSMQVLTPLDACFVTLASETSSGPARRAVLLASRISRAPDVHSD